MKSLNPGRLEDLILARLAVRTPVPTPKDLSKMLQPLAGRKLSPREWDAAFERALDALRAAGLVAAAKPPRPRARKMPRSRSAKPSKRRPSTGASKAAVTSQGLVITQAGQKRLQTLFRTKGRVAAKDWAELERKYVPALLFAELPAGTKRPALSAVILGQRLGVPIDRARNQKQVLDAWLCTSLGLRPGQKLTLDALRAALLARELGLPQRKSLKLEDVLGLAAVQLSGAASGDEDDVSDALVSRWLSEPERAPPTPVERIAAKALRAAEGPEARQFGPNKVFIGSVWRALATDPELSQLGEAAFKSQLVEAHRRGLLVLSRADLVAAMDPSDVAASEVTHQNATYHFICRGASA